MKGKDLLAAMHEPDDEESKKALAIETLEALRNALVKEGRYVVPIDDEFMRAAINSVFNGCQAGIEAGMESPSIQFVFFGMKHPESGKFCAEVMQQGLGLTEDKQVIVDTVTRGVEMVEGRIFVVLVDEAWMYEAKSETTSDMEKKLLAGDFKVSDLPEGTRKEALILNAIGCGVQYFVACPITRHEDGKRTVEKGDIICSRDKGTNIGGRMAVYGKPQ